jgi:6-phosphogluconolactonase
MIEEIPCSSLAEAAARLADALAASLRDGIARRGLGSLAVSGGRTPSHVFPQLAAVTLPWQNIVVTLTDERWVATDDPESNEGLARCRLLVGAAANARFVGLKTEAQTPGDGLAACAARLDAVPWPLDAVFLGMGEDGHVASLFADDPGWRSAKGRCVAVPATPGRRPRISLTPAALLASRRVFLIVAGKEKTITYRRALELGPSAALPVRAILMQDRAPVTVYRVSD